MPANQQTKNIIWKALSHKINIIFPLNLIFSDQNRLLSNLSCYFFTQTKNKEHTSIDKYTNEINNTQKIRLLSI